jgi:hypothetical protein
VAEQRDRSGGAAASAEIDRSAYEPVAKQGNVLTAYRLERKSVCSIVPAPTPRDWMLATRRKNANRCLPLLIANQAGWWLLNPDPFEAVWTGGSTANHVRIRSLREDGAPPRLVNAHFGYGVLTWQVPYLFRTPPGWNLVVRGPTNRPKDGIHALDGIVETDWAVATFTMNWKITRPNHAIRFDAEEPFCMVFPQRRGELEAFETDVRDITSDPELTRQFNAWQRSRETHLGQALVAQRMFGHDVADEMGYQRHYFMGTSPGGASAPVHQQKLSLCPFAHDGARADHDDGRENTSPAPAAADANGEDPGGPRTNGES